MVSFPFLCCYSAANRENWDIKLLQRRVLHRPTPTFDSPAVLPLAGTYITCIVPELIDYANIDAAFDVEDSPPSPSDHFIVENDALFSADEASDSSDGDGESHDELEREIGVNEASVLVKNGKFVAGNRTNLPSPSFGDLLLSKRTHQATAFEVSSDTFNSYGNGRAWLWLT